MDKNTKLIADHEAMHAARSRLIEAFIKIEEAASLLLGLAKIEQNGDSLGQKICKLQTAIPTASYSEERLNRVQALLVNASDLVAIRNSIVHAPMKLSTKSQTVVEARFSNQKQNSDGSYMTVALELMGLRFVAVHANQLALDLTDPQINDPVDQQNQSIWALIDEAQARPA